MTFKLNSDVLNTDLKYIHSKNNKKLFFKNKTILITGYLGFIGFELTSYFLKYQNNLKIKKLILIDIKKSKKFKKNKKIKLINKDISKLDLEKTLKKYNIDVIIHAASIASPTFYRINPIQTYESNIFGLDRILKYSKNNKVKRILYFSSSEIYGNPDKKNIPTKESYNGNVSPIGPRSCYDEAKRMCETMCFVYNKKYKLPIRIVRPFNNYGPGLIINDKRLPSDLAKCILNKKDIILYSNGKPTRSFCYISDAVIGYLKVLTHKNFGIFNIGNDSEEITVKKFALLFKNAGKKINGYNNKIRFLKSNDADYLKDNPDRRSPNIQLAKKKLRFYPKISTKNGVLKYLEYLNEKN